MAGTLADEFLADLNDDDAPPALIAVKPEQEDEEAMSIEPRLKDPASVYAIAGLLGGRELTRILQEIPKYTEKKERKMNFIVDETTGFAPRDPEYDLLVEANEMVSKINLEIINIHKYLKALYSKKFPELEHQVLHPLDYARVVKKLGNNLTNTQQDLAEILPSTNIIAISMTASSSSGHNLSPEELNYAFEGCEVALQLDEALQTILKFVESRMRLFAPNLTEVLGPVVAAKLIGLAGGLDKLAKMPASNLILLGRTKTTLEGFSSATVVKHRGFIGDCDLISTCPAHLHTRATRLIGNKCSLAARLDHTHDNHLNGEVGVQLREEIEKKIEKWQEPPPQRQEKVLPAPDDKPRKKRGGARRRKEKELYAMTEIKKRQMRMPFGEITEDVGNSMHSLGMFGMSEGSKKVRANVRDEKGMKIKKRKLKGNQTEMGFATSVYAFTPMQGLELAARGGAESQKPKPLVDGTVTSYFSNANGFSHVG